MTRLKSQRLKFSLNPDNAQNPLLKKRMQELLGLNNLDRKELKVGQLCRYVGGNSPRIRGLSRMEVVAIDGVHVTVTNENWLIKRTFQKFELKRIL